MGATRFVTFSSDYGLADEFVGVCHAVIARIAPDVRVIDLAHGLTGLRAGAAALAQSVAFAPDGVHLAIVDPGVGTERRGVAIVTQPGWLLVGPDNGLLIPASNVLGGATEAYELLEARFRLVPVSATFHGRDIFAPAAAHIARGVEPSELGPPVPLDELVRLAPPLCSVSQGSLLSDVIRSDGFGNLQLAATAADLRASGIGGRVTVSTAHGAGVDAVVGRTFADADAGGLVVLIDSAGFVGLAVNGGSAAERLGAPERVTIT